MSNAKNRTAPRLDNPSDFYCQVVLNMCHGLHRLDVISISKLLLHVLLEPFDRITFHDPIAFGNDNIVSLDRSLEARAPDYFSNICVDRTEDTRKPMRG